MCVACKKHLGIIKIDQNYNISILKQIGDKGKIFHVTKKTLYLQKFAYALQKLLGKEGFV